MIEPFLQKELRDLINKKAYRELNATALDKLHLDFSSNDYLGLAKHPELISLLEKYSTSCALGATGSRLLGGNSVAHEACEHVISEFVEYPKSLLFNSGYQLNVGVIATLYKKGDLVIADRYIHASIIDGILKSGATFKRFHHNDVDHLELLLSKYRSQHRHCLVVTEALFSMHADCAPIKDISKLAARFNAEFMLDEAHSIGVFGKQGKGLANELGVQPDYLIGTFGKAFGLSGAFIATSKVVTDYLVNKCRSFIYSTALPIVHVHLLSAAIEYVSNMDLARRKVFDLSRLLVRGLEKKGYRVLGDAYIVAIVLGTNEAVLSMQSLLRDKGINVAAIRHPTVAKNQECIRFSVRADHSEADINFLLDHV